MDVSEIEGVTEWLTWAVLGLASVLITMWNATIYGRLGRVEKKAKGNEDMVHAIELRISREFAEHELRERFRDEQHAADVQSEFKEVRERVENGHREILIKIAEISRAGSRRVDDK